MKDSRQFNSAVVSRFLNVSLKSAEFPHYMSSSTLLWSCIVQQPLSSSSSSVLSFIGHVVMIPATSHDVTIIRPSSHCCAIQEVHGKERKTKEKVKKERLRKDKLSIVGRKWDGLLGFWRAAFSTSAQRKIASLWSTAILSLVLKNLR